MLNIKDYRLYLLIAGFGVVAFILVAAFAPFGNRLFSLLYPKPPSQAYHQAFDVLDAAGNPLTKVNENQFTTNSLDVVIKLKDANALSDTTTASPVSNPSPISSSAIDNDGDGYQAGPIGTICPNGKLCDCYDSNAKVLPGQGSYFTTHRGDGSFDYNCNGTQDKDPAKNCNMPVGAGYNCRSAPSSDIHAGYHYSVTPPACGVADTFMRAQSYPTSICATPDSESQSCLTTLPGPYRIGSVFTNMTMGCR